MGLAHAKPTAEMTSAAKSFVDSLLNSHKVVVFSKSYCPYCHKAKSALNSMGLAPGAMEWVEIENRPDCDAIQDYMKTLTGARSVPRVFIGAQFFGGGDDTAAGAKNGKLAAALTAAGALQ